MNRVFDLLRKRTVQFVFIGGFAAATGGIELFLLVSGFHMDKNLAFAIQMAISLEVNFALSYLITWRESEGAFLGKFVRFHYTRIFTLVLNQILFAWLLSYIPYLIDYIVSLGLIMVLNFVVTENYVFSRKLSKLLSRQ